MSGLPFDAPPVPSKRPSCGSALRSKPRRSAGLSSCLVIPLLMSGCAYHHPPMPVQKAAVVLPKPAPHLLTEMPEPKCTYGDEEPAAVSGVETANAEPSGSRSDAGTSSAEQAPADTAALAETVQRRERERDCFRDAEARVRARLAELQSSVRVLMQTMEKQKRKLASAR